VADEEKNPVEGADVNVLNESRRGGHVTVCTTGADGRFEILGVEDGKYRVYADAVNSDLKGNGVTCRVQRGERSHVEITLPKRPTTVPRLDISCLLDLPLGCKLGKRIYFAILRISEAGERNYLWTNKQPVHEGDLSFDVGGFELGKLYAIEICSGDLFGREVVEIDTEKPELVVSLERGAKVTGVVQDGEGHVLEGVEVYRHIDGERIGPISKTDKQGSFILRGLPPDEEIEVAVKAYSTEKKREWSLVKKVLTSEVVVDIGHLLFPR
jgi:hypothetical protein